MDWNRALTRACGDVPGLIRAALALMPEGYLITGIGGGALDHEPLIRSAARCFAASHVALASDRAPARFVEFVFVTVEGLVVLQAGRRVPRVGLAVACTHETNLALVITSTRRALESIETNGDFEALEA